MKNHIIFALARVAVFTLAHTPKVLQAPLGALLGRVALALAKHERNLSKKQLKSAYGDLSERRVKHLLNGIANAIGRNALEATTLLKKRVSLPEVILPEPSKIVLEDALAEGKGVVFITGHLGNWELMAAWLARQGYPIHTVARPSYDPRFTKLIDAGRRRNGVNTIFRGAPGAAAAMLRALKKGGVLGFLIDQDTDVKSVFVPFFGRLAKTPVGPAAFAARTGAPVVIGTIHRLRHGGHQIDIERCVPHQDETLATAQFTEALESRIRRHPSEWVWFHNRWRSVPTEKTS